MNNLDHFQTLAARLFAAALLLVGTGSALADVRYVDVNSANPTPPYTNWTTAATNIQDAVDAVTLPGALVLVTNGIYAPIRVGADKLLTVLSVSGPHFTFIDGGQAVRCVYLTSGASLSGFTLTNGFICDGKGAGVACESQTAVVSNCVVAGNVAANCDLGGANGGGAYGGTLDNCTLSGNRAVYGGGAYLCILNNCTLTGNDSGGAYGGGAFHCTLNNCTLTGNSAASGGGAYTSTLNNCTLTGNSASYFGGGASYCTLNNCIVYFNTSTNGANYDSSSTLDYSCTTPQPTNGVGNITHAPLFVDTNGWVNLRLQAKSPCINAGLNALGPAGPDLDGNPRIKGGTVDMGAYEFEVVHYVDVNSANATPPYTNWSTAATNIQDAVDAAVAGDEIVVTNGIYATGGRVAAGDSTQNRVVVDKPLSLRSVNGPQSTTISGGGLVRCVYLSNSASLSGFTVTNGLAVYGAGLRCQSTDAVVSNCVVSGNSAGWYDGIGALLSAGGGTYGGTLNNCILSGNRVQGLFNGRWVGYGGGAFNATLNNCTLSNNFAAEDGGGAGGGTLNNCQLNGNSAFAYGGGAYGAILNNSALAGNSATFGGGMSVCSLNNCTLTGNFASGSGGGASGGTLNNCVVYFNTAPQRPNYEPSLGGPSHGTGDNPPPEPAITLTDCCTTPQPTNGVGNITSEPLFLDTNGWANLRLRSNSPCINAGLNALAPPGSDLDGNPRISGGTVDMGAYELQLPTSIISYTWLQHYGLAMDGSADVADPDGDGLNNWQEWRCGTDPTNALSTLRLLTPGPVGSGLVVRWESVAGRTYFLERSSTASSGFTPLATAIPGQPGTTAYTDTNANGAGPWFYRVGVSNP